MARSIWTTKYGTSGADWLYGSDTQNDKIFGGARDDHIFGYKGNDWLIGETGDDFLYGGYGNDLLDGGRGADYLNGGGGIDTITYASSALGVYVRLDQGRGYNGDAEGDTYVSIENVTASAHNDTIVGSNGANVLDGGRGNDRIYAKDGNDTLIGGSGADYMDGGNGTDTVSYASSTSLFGVELSLQQGVGYAGDANGDVFKDIENVTGTSRADWIKGDDGANRLSGGKGDDELWGLDGNDVLLGGSGNDTLEGHAGADVLNGGSGIDTTTYEDSNAAVSVDLQAGTGSGGHAAGDTLSSIENLIGSAYADTLLGNTAGNTIGGGGGNDLIEGRGGDDFLAGMGGSDTIVGGAGNDTMHGGFGMVGDGTDTFVFIDTRGAEVDTILDFDATEDIIDLRDTAVTGWDDLMNGGDRFMEQDGDDVVIHYYDHTIVLQNIYQSGGIDIADLSADNFLF